MSFQTRMYRSQGPYLYSPLSRALYERLQTDNEMKHYDKNQVDIFAFFAELVANSFLAFVNITRRTLERLVAWYACQTEILPPYMKNTFLELNCDQETELFLKNCTEKADWVFTQIFHALASTFLTLFMTKTSINGFLNRGSMFVFSGPQFEALLDIQSTWRGDHLLDIGAGDGKVTEKMAPYFHHISVTEASPVMRNVLVKKKFRLLDINTWSNDDTQYDVISCLNVLDRCDRPLTLLSQMVSKLKPIDGRLVIAVVIPFQPYVEFGTNGTRPLEDMPIQGKTFEDQVISFQDNVFNPAGLEVIKWSKVPYLCEGNLQRSYFWLIDVIFVLKVKQSTDVSAANSQITDSCKVNNEDIENNGKLHSERCLSTSGTCSSSDVVVDISQ